MSERKEQLKKGLSIVGSFLFGTDKDVEKQTEELAEAVDEKVEEVRARRRIALNPGPRK
jgi:hypothetical protein